MATLLIAIGGLMVVASFVARIIIAIDAFQDTPWKGLVGFFCCELYLMYYAAFEMDHDYKWPLLIGWLAGEWGGSYLINLASHMPR